MIPHFQLPGIVRPSHRRRQRTREELDEIRAKHAADCREALAREFGR